MRNAIIGFIIFIIVLTTFFGLSYIHNKSDRKEETEKILSHAVEKSIKECGIDDLKNITEDELKAKLLTSIISEVSSDSNITVKILNIDAKKGLLKVQVIETYKANNKKHTIAVTKTAIVENYRVSKDNEITISYYIKDNKNNDILVKKIIQKDNAKLNIPKPTELNGYKWYYDQTYTKIVNENYTVAELMEHSTEPNKTEIVLYGKK